MRKERFGTLSSGQAVERFTLDGGDRLRIAVLTYGGIIQAIETPDASGRMAGVALGFDTLDGYLERSPYFGALVGRYANRIGGAAFTLDGTARVLAPNVPPDTLHGGWQGFDKRVWDAEPDGDRSLALSYVSPDGEEGYPGTLGVRVVYTVTPQGELRIEYRATTDAPTVLNLTNHSYFNLAGAGEGDVLDHVLTIDADHYLPEDERQIPTGEVAPVAGTPFDFTRPHRIGERIGADHPQLRVGKGYDHCWVFNDGDGVRARVEEPTSGRVLEVLTTEPGVQFYTGNMLGTDGTPYAPYAALCLEAQHFPDSPNRPEFPSTVLRPGEEFVSVTTYRFGTVA
ncbi:galactose-1-epimerase [Spongiactinospora rosea]|uniref:Aldose 1-epimerase n=1 Tax=Spongiactinospora rosea TaxID=2248750 RepID=A0A366LKP5_9ACTN|nr:aldose epimerase family protein [Spongiactinospora rosea]RBQ14461.1 galactose-1-epimerase [Spongiactinospora rosea]